MSIACLFVPVLSALHFYHMQTADGDLSVLLLPVPLALMNELMSNPDGDKGHRGRLAKT